MELNEQKELLTTRQTMLARQEERMRTQLKDIQTQLQADLNPPVKRSRQLRARVKKSGGPWHT